MKELILAHSPTQEEIDGNGEHPRIFERDLSFIWCMTGGGGLNCSHSNQFCHQVSDFCLFLSVLIIRQLYQWTFKTTYEKYFTQILILI